MRGEERREGGRERRGKGGRKEERRKNVWMDTLMG
jgi:hypothetical protein